MVPPTEQNEPGVLPNKGPGGVGEVWNITTVPETSYTTIQAAIDVAAPGDTIIVGPGTYAEYLHITTDGLTIEGAGIDQSIIDLDGLTPYWHYGSCSGSYASRAGVYIVGYLSPGIPAEVVEDVTFRGFTVKNAGLNPPGGGSYPEFYDNNGDGWDDMRGIGIANGKNVTIEYCKVTDCGYGGISTGYARCISSAHKYSEGITIDNCIVTNHPWSGINIGNNVGSFTVTNNVCENIGQPHYSDPTREYMGYGIQVSGRSSSLMTGGLISDNTCSNNGFEGIIVKKYTDGVIIENNTVTGHNSDEDGAGIFLYHIDHPEWCKNHIVRNNAVTGNIRGIVTYYAQGCTIEDNTITIDSGTFNPGQEGIKIDGSNNIIVRNNVITGSDGTGIKVQNTWNGIESYNNNITDNTITNVGFPGIKVSSNARNNTFTDNTITGAHFAGIFIYLGAYDNTFTCNTITDTVNKTLYISQPYAETQGDGVFLWGYSGLEAGTGNAFHYNNIYGNADDGMENQTTTEVDAECNWWGDDSGPTHLSNPLGTGDNVSDNVDFDPWIGITYLSGPTDPVQVGNPVNIDFSFSCNMGTATLDWDDGTQFTYSTNSETKTESHAYSEAGVYTVTLTIEDCCSRSYSKEFQYVVVYDPTGGFVTGGGWIYSPAGAYSGTDLEGKATFGFVSKYKKGQQAPTGNTEFQFKAGDLNFHSDNYDWLVIAGHKAMYKGTGTINGAGAYGFMLFAIDEKLTPSIDVDMFRIKIWDNTSIIYDNKPGADDNAEPTTAISGGQIVIHKAK